jgi:hypothetical protein
MFDDDESIVDGDFSSLLREESDAYRDSEVVTPDPEEESLSDTRAGKKARGSKLGSGSERLGSARGGSRA